MANVDDTRSSKKLGGSTKLISSGSSCDGSVEARRRVGGVLEVCISIASPPLHVLELRSFIRPRVAVRAVNVVGRCNDGGEAVVRRLRSDAPSSSPNMLLLRCGLCRLVLDSALFMDMGESHFLMLVLAVDGELLLRAERSACPVFSRASRSPTSNHFPLVGSCRTNDPPCSRISSMIVETRIPFANLLVACE